MESRELNQSLPSGTSAVAEVLPDRQALVAIGPPIAPLPAEDARAFLGVKPNIKDMTLDEKFVCLKQCFAYGYGIRKVLVEVFESIVAEFKTYAKDRKGMPTVEEAFKQRGLNYKTVYSGIQREKERRTEDAKFFEQIMAQASANIRGVQVTDNDLPPVGEKVVVENGRRAVVLTHGVADGGSKTAEVMYEDDGTSEIKKAGSLVTVVEVSAAKAAAKANKDNGKTGNGGKAGLDVLAKPEDVLARIEADTLRAHDMDADEAKSLRVPKPEHTKLEKMAIKIATFIASNSDLGRKLPRTPSNGWKLFGLSAELLRAAGDKVKGDEETVGLDAKPKSGTAANGNVPTAKAEAKSLLKKEDPKTELVKIARIGNTDEFGVFPESCWSYTTANALTIETRQVCEAERDRINAKRLAKSLPDATNEVVHPGAHQNQEQHPAAEAPANPNQAINVSLTWT